MTYHRMMRLKFTTSPEKGAKYSNYFHKTSQEKHMLINPILAQGERYIYIHNGSSSTISTDMGDLINYSLSIFSGKRFRIISGSINIWGFTDFLESSLV